mgnify:CR=1 FL=1
MRDHVARAAAALAVALTLVLLAGCGQDGRGTQDGEEPQEFPDVVTVELAETDPGTYDVSVTVSSPYDSPERYADGWRVLAPDGTVLGEHELLHDHAGEQPFTRTQTGLEIPADVAEVTVEGRDLANGYGGATTTVDVPR